MFSILVESAATYSRKPFTNSTPASLLVSLASKNAEKNTPFAFSPARSAMEMSSQVSPAMIWQSTPFSRA